jgi:hypothetical protein
MKKGSAKDESFYENAENEMRLRGGELDDQLAQASKQASARKKKAA